MSIILLIIVVMVGQFPTNIVVKEFPTMGECSRAAEILSLQAVQFPELVPSHNAFCHELRRSASFPGEPGSIPAPGLIAARHESRGGFSFGGRLND